MGCHYRIVTIFARIRCKNWWCTTLKRKEQVLFFGRCNNTTMHNDDSMKTVTEYQSVTVALTYGRDPLQSFTPNQTNQKRNYAESCHRCYIPPLLPHPPGRLKKRPTRYFRHRNICSCAYSNLSYFKSRHVIVATLLPLLLSLYFLLLAQLMMTYANHTREHLEHTVGYCYGTIAAPPIPTSCP